jgi:hypothetical protein
MNDDMNDEMNEEIKKQLEAVKQNEFAIQDIPEDNLTLFKQIFNKYKQLNYNIKELKLQIPEYFV